VGSAMAPEIGTSETPLKIATSAAGRTAILAAARAPATSGEAVTVLPVRPRDRRLLVHSKVWVTEPVPG
jgi:hypothetical protein